MQWTQLQGSMLAEVSVGALIFVAIFLIVWGTIAISSIKAAARKTTALRTTPPPLPPAGNRRVPPPLPRVGTRVNVPPAPTVRRGPMTGVAAKLPPLPQKAQGATVNRAALKARGVRIGKQQAPVAPTLPQPDKVASGGGGLRAGDTTSSPAQVRSAVSSWLNVNTLRSQFLLAEALRPPVALRKDPFTSN